MFRGNRDGFQTSSLSHKVYRSSGALSRDYSHRVIGQISLRVNQSEAVFKCPVITLLDAAGCITLHKLLALLTSREQLLQQLTPVSYYKSSSCCCSCCSCSFQREIERQTRDTCSGERLCLLCSALLCSALLCSALLCSALLSVSLSPSLSLSLSLSLSPRY